MAYHYLRESDAESPHRLPDVEVFEALAVTCPECRLVSFEDAIHEDGCSEPDTLTTEDGWWYAYLDGGDSCWASDPSGPYPTQDAALAAAREDAGLCTHGREDDEPCGWCDEPSTEEEVRS